MLIMSCILISINYCLFFVFKQKTAYEMRISDWISDVCSSDLGIRAAGSSQGPLAEQAGRPEDQDQGHHQEHGAVHEQREADAADRAGHAEEDRKSAV